MATEKPSFYSFQVNDLRGKPFDMSSLKGKVVLVVNTASKCGLTPQYEGLEAAYKKYKDQGFVILGFPCNQFGGQEPGSESDIQNFCSVNFGVSFPMFEKIDVNGDNTHPLYKFLKEEQKWMFDSMSRIRWNFEKFLVDKNGNVVERYAPTTTVSSAEKKIEQLLKA